MLLYLEIVEHSEIWAVTYQTEKDRTHRKNLYEKVYSSENKQSYAAIKANKIVSK